MNRQRRQELAQETREIVAAGGYRDVRIAAAVAAAVAGTHMHEPDDPTLDGPVPGGHAGRIAVTGETTLAAARRLSADGQPVACLNFASAKNPGGGYLSGAQAQEESLARSSALATCLHSAAEFYSFHRKQADPAYSDRVICSPEVPVFRDDTGSLLDEPYLVTFLTAAAPNAGVLRDRGRQVDLDAILSRRARQVLAAAALHDQRQLVLGAWGCGVFRNDPAMVADVFGRLLDGEFRYAFDEVTFAVLDAAPGAPTLQAFENRLGVSRP